MKSVFKRARAVGHRWFNTMLGCERNTLRKDKGWQCEIHKQTQRDIKEITMEQVNEAKKQIEFDKLV